MKKLGLGIQKVVYAISEWGLVTSGFFILIMAFLSTYGVARRYIFNNPEPYSYELATCMLVATVAFAIAGLQKQVRHLRVDFLANMFPKKAQDILMYIVTPLLGMAFVTVVMYYSWDNALYSFNIGETSQSAWEEVVWPTKMSIPLGMLVLDLVLLVQFVQGIFIAAGKAEAVSTKIDLPDVNGSSLGKEK